MKRLVAVLGLAILACTSSVRAQSGSTATFTWTTASSSGGVDSASFSTIDGQPTSPAGGWGGSLSVSNGIWLGVILPEPQTCSSTGVVSDPCPNGGIIFPTFPNNGFLENGPGGTLITWGPKVYVIGDGTHAGDAYTMTGTATAVEWNGSVAISITEYRVMVSHRYCGRFGCHYFLIDTLTSGSGTTTVQ